MDNNLQSAFEQALVLGNSVNRLPGSATARSIEGAQIVANDVNSSDLTMQALTGQGMNTETGVFMDLNAGSMQFNTMPSFTIDATNALADSYLRLGSMYGYNENWKLNPGFAGKPGTDSEALTNDKWGPMVPYCQYFSEMVSFSPILITGFRMITSNATQLYADLVVQKAFIDGTNVEISRALATSYQTTDNRIDFVNYPIQQILGPSTWLEMKITKGATLTIILTIAAMNTVRSFTNVGN